MRSLLERGGALRPSIDAPGASGEEGRLESYTRQLILGVTFLHESGVCHRDIKCSNLLLSGDLRRLKVADFGQIKWLTSHSARGLSGSPLWLAPEVIKEEIDRSADTSRAYMRADVWSLGCTVVEMATTDGFPDMVLDLCCGGGVLGLEVARAAAEQGVEAARVLGVELSTSGARDARVNAAANSLRHPQYEVICGKAEDCIGAIAGAATSANAVAILDPPRTGMAPSVCKALRATEAVKRVVLCSCNPHGHNLRRDFVVKGGSLASNLRVLCSERGRGTPFRVERIVPIDLFEHTPHVELCVLCVRAPSRSPTSTRPRPTRRERKRP